MDNRIQITALNAEMFVAFLRKAGSRLITEERLQTDLENGAPRNADGTINLVAYGAWLARQRIEESAND